MKVLGTDLYDLGFDRAVEDLITLASSEPLNHCISASDAHVLVLAKRQPDFRMIVQSFYWNLPDGMPSVWLMRWKGAKQANRISGPHFFEMTIKATSDMNINHFLCGGEAGVANQLKLVCQRWKNNHIVGTLSPPFRSLTTSDYEQIAADIKRSGANIVWVGLGAPKQIYFANELKKYTNVQAIITVGAAFDFHTERVKKAPKWIQNIGMEWLFRVIQEPRRLLKRYFKTIPMFLWYGLIDLMKGER